MPRRSKNLKTDDKPEKTNKKNLMNTIVKDVIMVENEDIILQLPISDAQINHINNTDNIDTIIPEPYEPNCFYLNESNTFNNIQDNNIDHEYFGNDSTCLQGIQPLQSFPQSFNDMGQIGQSFTQNVIKSTNNCYWCCHPIENRVFGMPYKYNTITDTYVLYGSFCSLQCANAYNFSVHCGSDKVWEINSFIQMLSKHYGYIYPIRPAPSRFLLKLFNGPLTIEEFRRTHINTDKTHLLNLPPMISTTFNYEVVNTSYLKNITDNMNIMKSNQHQQPIGKKTNKNTIDSKLNLIISS